MDLKINLDIQNLKTVYEDYKQYLIPIGTILASFLILFLIVFPQFRLISDTQEKRDEEKVKLSILNANLANLESISESDLTNDLFIVTAALPIQKNFEAVLGAVSSAANASGVFLGDYQFQVGDITRPPVAGGGKYPSIEINLNINANVEGTIRFMEEIYRTVPLVEIKGVNVSGENTVISLVFFFKPLPPKGLDPSLKFRIITQKDKDLMNLISKYNNINSQSSLELSPSLVPSPISSPSPAL